MSSPIPIEDWSAAVVNFSHFVAQVQDWTMPSPCPGWTVGDLVAHAIDVEGMLAGDPRPVHEPDWERLAHVSSDFGRFAEIGVDFRRGRPRAELLDELTATHQRAVERVALLGSDASIAWFSGETPVPVVVGMRTFDAWVHEQDARSAVGVGGNLTGPGSQNALRLLSSRLPKVWAASVGAPLGSVAHVMITEPGLTADYWIGVGPDGRGVFVDPSSASTSVSLTWPAFVTVATGRSTRRDAIDTAVISGDHVLGRALLENLIATP